MDTEYELHGNFDWQDYDDHVSEEQYLQEFENEQN